MAHAPLNVAVTALDPPPIPAVQAAARRYDGRLGPLLDLSQAVPGYPAHDLLLAALGESAADPALLGYGPIEGERVLREAYAASLSGRYGAPVAAGEVLIAAGCNQAFVAAAMTVAGAGDAIVLVTPFYFNHASTLAMLGIDVRACPADPGRGFLPDPEALRRAIVPGVRAVALVSPDNPTGRICPPALLGAILEVCVERDVWLLLDETYRDFLPGPSGAVTGGAPPHALFARAGTAPWQDHLITLASFSKSWCIPGHRLGALTAGEAVIGEIAKVMDNVQICAPRAAQHALARVMPALDGWREANRLEIERRATALRHAFDALPGWHLASLGAYFAYARHPWADEDSVVVAARLAEERGVLTLPGAFFGAGQERYLRIAFANVDAATLERLPERLGGHAAGRVGDG